MASIDCSPLYKNRPPWDFVNPPIGSCKINKYTVTPSTLVINSIAGPELLLTSNIQLSVPGINPITKEPIQKNIVLEGKCTNEINVKITKQDLGNLDFRYAVTVTFRDRIETDTLIVHQFPATGCTPNAIQWLYGFFSNSTLVNVSVAANSGGNCIEPIDANLSGGDGPPQRPSPYDPPPAGINTGPMRSIAINSTTDALIQYDWDNDGWIPFETDSDCRIS